MDVISYRIALVALALGVILSIGAVTALAMLGKEPPPLLATLAGVCAGALAMAVHRPRSDGGAIGTNGHGAGDRRGDAPSPPERTKPL